MTVFTDEHEMFRQTVRDFVEKEINPHAEAWEAAGMFPAHELFPKLGAIGVLGIEYDPRYGGQGADHLYTAIYGEEFGRSATGGVAMAVSVQTDMATPALHRFGSHELKERYLAPAIRGEMVAAIAVTEPDAGSDVAGIRTRAVRDGDEWIINGTKLYITNGVQADWLCLLVRTSDEGGYRGMSQIVVPTDVPGFSVSRKLDKMGNRASDTAELAFQDMRVPAENLLGQEGGGFYEVIRVFQRERLVAGLHAVAGCERALEDTIAYVQQRQAFGGPLSQKQVVRHKLADLATLIEAARGLCLRALWLADRGLSCTKESAMAKWWAPRLAVDTIHQCLLLHGHYG